MIRSVFVNFLGFMLLCSSPLMAGISFVCNPIDRCSNGFSLEDGEAFANCKKYDAKDKLQRLFINPVFLKVEASGVRIQDPKHTNDIELLMDDFQIGFDNINPDPPKKTLIRFFGRVKHASSSTNMGLLDTRYYLSPVYFAYSAVRVKENLNYKQGVLTRVSIQMDLPGTSGTSLTNYDCEQQ